MIFYVYEYWRPDTGVCFYVGKGRGKRAWEFRRRHHCGHIIQKLRSAGHQVDVRIIRDGMGEQEALAFEIERISYWRACGVVLSNITGGGEGVCGLKHSATTKALIRLKRKGQVIAHSEETKRKIGVSNSIALKGKKNPEHSARLKGRKLSMEHRLNISVSGLGRVVSPETRIRLRASNVGKTRSASTKEKLRLSHLGKTASAETRARMAESQRRRWAATKLQVE